MVTVKPAGAALSAQTSNIVSLTVSYLEQYSKPRCCKCLSPIQTTVSYSIGEKSLAGTTLFVPVIAIVTAIYKKCNGETLMKTFAETFDIAFQGQDVLTSSATVTSYGLTSNANTSSCGITTLALDDSITIEIG